MVKTGITYEELCLTFPEYEFLPPEVVAQRAISYWDASPTSAAAIFMPRSAEEVSLFLKKCNERQQRVVVQGGLTGCAQGAKADPDTVILSLERMREIEDIDGRERVAIVQAGCILQVLQNAVAEKGLYFPVDLGARGSCTIGGNIATNAGGVNVLRYGMIRNHILGIEAVLADGTIVSSMNRMMKNNAGYDLKQMFIGTEGTLGVVTRAVLRLEEETCGQETALVGFRDFFNVPKFLRHMQKAVSGQLIAFEAMWGDYYRAVTIPENGHVSPLGRDHSHYVLLEAPGELASESETGFRVGLEEAFQAGLIEDAVIAKSGSEREAIWKTREDFELIIENKPSFLFDVSLPIGDMPAYVDEVVRRVKRRWQNGQCYVLGHVADGNLHLFVCPGEGGNELREIADAIVYEPLACYGGSISAEHGIGHEKKTWLHISRTRTEIDIMRRLKKVFDPKTILNRGVVFD